VVSLSPSKPHVSTAHFFERRLPSKRNLWASYRAPSSRSVSYSELVGLALCGDTLSCICNLCGLEWLHVIARVCRAWRGAVRDKFSEWGVLQYLRRLGNGFGKKKGQFDMPSWISILPDGNLCIVDSCNYRLQVINPKDGSVLKVIARPGANMGEHSSPSGVAWGGGKHVFASTNVNPNHRKVLTFDLQTWKLVMSSAGRGTRVLDAPEGMVAIEELKRLFVVDTARHRVVAFDSRSLEVTGSFPPLSRVSLPVPGQTWCQLNCPQDVASYGGELFVSDTHNDRIQVLSTDMSWLGVIGCKGTGPGQFRYPRGVAIANGLLYVCEATRIQALTLVGEPRIVLPVPGASSLTNTTWSAFELKSQTTTTS